MELSYIQTALLDFICNYIDFLILELITATFFSYKCKKNYYYYRTLFLCIILTTSMIPHIPYFELLFWGIEFSYILLVSSFQWKKSLFFFFKYKAIYYCLFFICVSVISIIDVSILNSSSRTDVYYYYQSITDAAFMFMILNIFLYHRRLKYINRKSSISLNFTLFAIFSILLLLYYNRFLLKYQELNATFSYMFLFVVGVIIFSTYNYRKLIEMMDEQIQQKVLIEKYTFQLSYVKDVDESLKALHKIRHDFKNHLLIIDGYASKNELDKQRKYIRKLNDEIGATKIYDTPNQLISSILNTKNSVCEKHGGILNVVYQFQSINIDDFNLITILGNILDNAITASTKTGSGIIDLSIMQLDSYLEITCKNNHCETLKERNGTLLTTKKENKENHGIGLGNVKDCVEKLHGQCNLEYDDMYFCIKITLPNYLDKSKKEGTGN